MRKRVSKWILAVVGLFILAIGFLFWYGLKHPRQTTAPQRPGEQYGVEYRKPGEIVTENLGATKRVTDKRQGYSVEVPSDWQVEEPTTVNAITNFYDTQNGCTFSSGYLESSMLAAEFVKEQSDRDNPELTIRKYEVSDIYVAGFAAKHVILDSLENGYSEAVYFNAPQKLFVVSVGDSGSNREKCLDKFSAILASIIF